MNVKIKKTIFSFIFAAMIAMGIASCNSCATADNSGADSTTVDTVLVDSTAIDSIVAVDSAAVDTTVVSE